MPVGPAYDTRALEAYVSTRSRMCDTRALDHRDGSLELNRYGIESGEQRHRWHRECQYLCLWTPQPSRSAVRS